MPARRAAIRSNHIDRLRVLAKPLEQRHYILLGSEDSFTQEFSVPDAGSYYLYVAYLRQGLATRRPHRGGGAGRHLQRLTATWASGRSLSPSSYNHSQHFGGGSRLGRAGSGRLYRLCDVGRPTPVRGCPGALTCAPPDRDRSLSVEGRHPVDLPRYPPGPQQRGRQVDPGPNARGSTGLELEGQ